MRTAAYLACLALVAVAITLADLRIALLAAGVKSVLVGAELMELRHAHRLHLVAFVAFIGLLATSLVILA
ncbi:MAG: hypothetical protein KF901_15960 [Myxococcales bacterium]|nr:hypothetical protein [Myxococcales bacterium]